jgi:hypothetical protein
MTKTEYFEDYAIGAQRETSGRTVTEADVVIHAATAEIIFLIMSTLNSLAPLLSASASRMAP